MSDVDPTEAASAAGHTKPDSNCSTSPSLSVIIAAKDAARTIDRALRSILEQPFADLEVLVVDDASADATAELVSSNGDPRVRLLRLDRNVGRGAARNHAIHASAGRYVGILDADDVALGCRFEESVRLLESNPELVVVSGQARFVSGGWSWSLAKYPTEDADIRAGLDRGIMTVCHPAATIRREALLSAGGYKTDLPRAQDFDLMRRLTQYGRFRSSERHFVDYYHPVLISFDYWFETRRCTEAALAGVAPDASPPTSSDRLRHAAVLARRAAIFLRTRGRRD